MTIRPRTLARKTPRTTPPRSVARASRAPTLPAALARNAKAKHDARVAALTQTGRDAIALVLERRETIAANFFDVGTALVTLKRPEIIAALGRKSFAEVCQRDLDMGLSKANRLIDMATRMRRPLVRELGQERASAVLELVDATPEDDVPEDVVHATLRLPSGKKLHVADAATEAIRQAATEFRQARSGRARGRTTTPVERERVEALAKRAKGVGDLTDVQFRLVAMGARRGADVVVRMPLAQFDRFVRTFARRK